MSLPGSQRREQRRRLLVAWSRGTPAAGGDATGGRAAPTEYAAEALPERHPGIATLLPRTLGGFAAAAAGIALPLGAFLAFGFHEPSFAALDRVAGQRYGQSIAAARSCLDPGLATSVCGWMSHVLLLAAAVVALVVRHMRRHRRDDYAGRYRAWGWLAVLLTAASFAAHVPVGRLVGALCSDATGVTFGPAGFGWWVTITSTLLVGVSLWAVLPLHERFPTAFWLTAGLAAWAVSAVAAWRPSAVVGHPGAPLAAWAAGSGLVAIAMLAAARSVTREVRGESRSSPRIARPKPAAVATSGDVPDRQPPDDAAIIGVADADDTPQTEYTDGSDPDEDRGSRHLSKAERKRLKKLARLNRAA